MTRIDRLRFFPVLYTIGFWVPLAACTYVALIPNPEDVVGKWSDALLHAFAFAYLTGALTLAHYDRERRESSVDAATWWRPLAWMLAYGLALEVAQSFTVERSAEYKDLAFDLGGIAFGLIGYRVFAFLRRRLVY